MRMIGVEIDGTKAYFCALEKLPSGDLVNITGKFKSLTLKNSTDNTEVKEFQNAVHTFFDGINPKRIAILSRASKGKFSASPLSFKLEGLIQIYSPIEVEFISPATITAHYKKNNFPIVPTYKNEIPSAKLSYYLMTK